MNVELLRKVQEAILADPKSFDMSDFQRDTECGTAYCIGGWAAKLAGERVGAREGQEALDLTYEQANRLFYVTDIRWIEDHDTEEIDLWPKQFQGVNSPWLPTPQQAVDRIDWFIDTEGRE
jgi:hypothetical protein